jgi:hypothetical protein
MPSIKWSEIDRILHRTKGTLTKIVGVEKHCQRLLKVIARIPKVSTTEQEEIKELGKDIIAYCITVRSEAIAEIEAINEVILSQIENGEDL